MGLLETFYKKNFSSKYNIFLIFFSFFLILSIVVFFIFLFQVRFKEIFIGKGVLVPSVEKSISLNFNGMVSHNTLIKGQEYRKGDILLKFEKSHIEREITTLKKELQYKQTKIDISHTMMSVIECKQLEFEIHKLSDKIVDLQEELEEKIITAPFDCIVVASAYEGFQKGMINRGSVICKIISVNNSLIEVSLSDSWIGKIKSDQKCIIRKKERKMYGAVLRVTIEEHNGIYAQNAYIKLNDVELREFGVEFDIKIITEEISIKNFFIRTFTS